MSAMYILIYVYPKCFMSHNALECLLRYEYLKTNDIWTVNDDDQFFSMYSFINEC